MKKSIFFYYLMLRDYRYVNIATLLRKDNKTQTDLQRNLLAIATGSAESRWENILLLSL